MIRQLNFSRAQLVDFCRRWKVAKMALFGSVLREDFRPDSDVDVLAVSLHVHERIDPRSIIEAVRRVNSGQGIVDSVQLSLFEEERAEPLREAIEFYQHKHGWSNRLIAGDSLLALNARHVVRLYRHEQTF